MVQVTQVLICQQSLGTHEELVKRDSTAYGTVASYFIEFLDVIDGIYNCNEIAVVLRVGLSPHCPGTTCTALYCLKLMYFFVLGQQTS